MEENSCEDDDDTYESLEKHFKDVLNQLTEDKDMCKFHMEYEKLTNALRKSHESERRLMTKCRELNAEIVSKSTKIATALKLSQEDQATIISLKKEVEKAWEMFDAVHSKETMAKETIQSLKEEISNLTKQVEEGANLSKGKDSVHDLLSMNDKLTKERDELLSTVEILRENLTEATSNQEEMESQKESTLETVSKLQQELQVYQSKITRESWRNEKLEKEVNQLHADMGAKTAEIKSLTLQSQRAKDEQQRLEQQLEELKTLNDRASSKMEQLQVQNSKQQQENEQLSWAVDQLSTENQQKATDLKMREEEVNQKRQEIVKVMKMSKAIQKKLHQMEDQKAEADRQREVLQTQLTKLGKELEASQKQAEADRKSIDELVRERDILNKKMIQAAVAKEEQQSFVKLQEQTKKNLEQEIHNYREETERQRKTIQQLEKNRNRHINETSSLMQKVQQHMSDIEIREKELFEYKKKTAEMERTLKQQQNLFESVMAERNLYSRNLVENQVDITEMKIKLKIMNKENDQLKEQSSGKELALLKEHQEFQRVERENEALKGELQLLKQQAEEAKQRVDSQEAEEQKLHKIIADADAEKLRQKQEMDQVIHDRDIFGTHLLRRNDERALLYKKISILQTILNKGDRQYNQRLDDIRLLKLEIKRLRREKGILDKGEVTMEDLRRELFHTERELQKERTRCRALEEQLKNPIQVHRWRRLEATDPDKYQLILKIHSLQRRLITKTQEVVDEELLLQEKEKQYGELKQIMARWPGPEAAEKLQECQRTIRDKTDKLKALSAEVNMYYAQTKEYKLEIQRLNHELHNIKMKYLSQKQQQREESSKAKVEHPTALPPISSKLALTGGGFRLDKLRKN
ncbi:cilia- and flagella-associated protein 58 [Lampris incognitus]|uniref:cilia- and flagella-associated protein 58 n=1 Tax=Lampris incognitus TaxID=2546036 RepID=UPI0024B599F6|nr:cilia- and flagella-associated protein 58 [Lampris incognitus]